MKFAFQLCRVAAVALGAVFLLPSGTEGSLVEGKTRILSYEVNMTIQSRFARTHVVVEVLNEKNCSTTKGFTFQLPLDARVTDLKMDSGLCQLNGTVKAEAQAEEEFAQSASQGRPAALLRAYDTTNYGVQLSLPPEGRTVLEISLEQLLRRQRGQIDFQVPIYPGLPVDLLTFDLTIDEGQSGISKIEFIEDVGHSGLAGLHVVSNGAGTGATAHLELTDVRDTDSDLELTYVPGTDFRGKPPLPRLLRGFYDPGPLPAEGLLIPNTLGTCFVHLFNPDTLLSGTGSLPRNIVFVIDVSGSMSGQKLEDAKAAFAAIIQKLTDEDYFTVHSFSSDGVEEKFGPSQATSAAREEGEEFVRKLEINGGTNLEGAYVEGIRQVERMQNARGGDSAFVPVVMVLTDGQPSAGVTDPQGISRNVKAVNGDGVNAKVYGLAFGNGADYNLLSAISLQNAGHATRIFEGYGDATTQMENFYVGNLGTIVMSDVNVSFDGTVVIDSQTQTQFPVFADGSEVAVRARVLEGRGGTIDGATANFLEATTTANTVDGVSTWRTEVSGWGGDGGLLPQQNECVQSFAHAKISELMLFRDAAKTLGSEMDAYYDIYSLQNGLTVDVGRDGARRQEQLDVVSLVEDEALQLALEANVVWPGLTAMVTVESGSCLQMKNTEVCYDGEGDGPDEDYSSSSYSSSSDEGVFLQQSAPAPAPGSTADAGRTQMTYGGTAADFDDKGGGYYGASSGSWPSCFLSIVLACASICVLLF